MCLLHTVHGANARDVGVCLGGWTMQEGVKKGHRTC